MTKYNKYTAVLIQDDPAERLQMQSAWELSCCQSRLKMVSNGEELMDYLHRRRVYAEPGNAPIPDLILLDVKMPATSGFEVLKALKREAILSQIPVVILSHSKNRRDIQRAYYLGASAFITKPASFAKFFEMVKLLNKYWFNTALLPRFLHAGCVNTPGVI